MPQTLLLEVLNKAAAYLKEKGVPQARLDADLLLAQVLGAKRLDLYLQFDRPLSDVELEPFRAFIRRRGRREPLQHILGETEFRELRLKTDARALIPRSETEILVDIVIKNLPAVDRPRILDLGTGTGAIALSLAKEIPACEVTASDISSACLELTRENSAGNGLPVPELILGNLFESFSPNRLWHIVVANPPYIAEGDIARLASEVRDHDPHSALVGGEKGWELPLQVMTHSFSRLEPGGFLAMEIDPPQFPMLKEKALEQGWARVKSESDYQGFQRFLLAFL